MPSIHVHGLREVACPLAAFGGSMRPWLYRGCPLYGGSVIRGFTVYKVTKRFSERKQAHVEMEPTKTRQTRWEQPHNIFTPSLHLVPFCLVLVCVHGRVVEGTGLGSAHGCVVHVDVHGE